MSEADSSSTTGLLEGSSTSSSPGLTQGVVRAGELPMFLLIRQEHERRDRDENDLWMENEKLKDDLKKLKQKERKMLKTEKVVQGQLMYSEEERYRLEGELNQANDKCHFQQKQLVEIAEQLRLAKLELESIRSSLDVSRLEEQKIGNKKQENDKLKRVEESEISRSYQNQLKRLFDAQESLQILELKQHIDAQETMITDLNRTISELFSSRELLASVEPSVEHYTPFLSEEIRYPDNQIHSLEAQETKTVAMHGTQQVTCSTLSSRKYLTSDKKSMKDLKRTDSWGKILFNIMFCIREMIGTVLSNDFWR
ncbi:hypothetical protein PtA15_5A791 [Puccinia triticina]|uniref:Pericentrin/AKAP-450 centrosomal targeting domain-containing protein n=1 Tax=Puccinia triticina TaxID=208348 RepID=A0ABY7CML6_9BASI|nr:uncharacterized protein PtA15_5A791 [Puccinia triticina]WAQ85217.1 hypothetical protein PtA15_5A791 [Puccinia triticina]